MSGKSSGSSGRTWGVAPHRVVLLHGGPGAPGEMEPVARRLSLSRGVLEPFQTARSIDGQVSDLRAQLCDLPVTLVGFSWGAWLAVILAARHPEAVRKLILIGAGAFEQCYTVSLRETRMSRLGEGERAEWEALLGRRPPSTAELARIGELAAKTDLFDPLPDTTEVTLDGEVYSAVWEEAAELRRSGALLKLALSLTCPVIAIHGAYDPSPAAGVRDPLAPLRDRFRMHVLPVCGHKPWVERQAREAFYSLLESEVD